jgi:tRNA(Ser,Leu) C12 N-acetylase TAN1
MDWNVIVTVRAGPGHEKALLQGLKGYGEFHASDFKYVCYGRVDNLPAFLAAVQDAQQAGAVWTQYLARLVPVERTFHFDADGFIERLKAAVTPFAQRMGSGRFFVRVERRGMLGRLHSQEAERAVADHLIDLVAARGERLTTDFADPDWIVVCETLGAEAGVALLDRGMRMHYPFLQVH